MKMITVLFLVPAVTVLITGCATSIPLPENKMVVSETHGPENTLRHIIDSRKGKTKHTRGFGTSVVIYGDDVLLPTPINILDSALDRQLADKLGGEKVVIKEFIVGRRPIIKQSVYGQSIAGVSLPLAILVDSVETYPDTEIFECDISGSVGNRTWWVRQDIPPSSDDVAEDVSADIKTLVAVCAADATRKIQEVIE